VQEQSVRPAPLGERLVRQLHALDAWNAFRQQRERQLTAAELSRDERMFARFEIESMLRTHAAVLHRVTLALASAGDAATSPSPTAVIAHRSQWFGDRVRRAVEASGTRVLECTDNGAEALGVVIAEQPDCVFASDRLAMVSGEQLVAQTTCYSPLTQLFVHAEQDPEAPFQRAGCVVLTSRHRPNEVAGAMSQPSPSTP
jgi:hypothetical protein